MSNACERWQGLIIRPRSGRPIVTTRRHDQLTCLCHLRIHHLTASESAQKNPHRPSQLSYSSRNCEVPITRLWYTGPASLRWSVSHFFASLGFQMRQWRRIFFTDKSRFADIVLTDVVANAPWIAMSEQSCRSLLSPYTSAMG